jgi:putative acetyltransferase
MAVLRPPPTRGAEKVNRAHAIDIRLAQSSDLPTLRRIYADSVAILGPAAYTPAQVAVWQGFAGEAEFDDFILAANTYVAILGADLVGFCGIADDGHVASVYVRPACCRQGIGGTLLREVLARHPSPVSGRYYAEASCFSLPLFLRSGFERTGSEQVERNGVAFERFLVARRVGPRGCGKD